MDFTFNLANGSATGNRLFGGMLLGFGDNPYDATNGIVLGFNTTGTSALNVEFVSGTGANAKKVTVRVTGLNNTDKKYKFTKALLESAGIPGFNVADIRSITVVVNDVVTGSATATGSVKFLGAGLAFTPVINTTTTKALTDLSALQPAAGELEPCATANQDPCTSGTLNTIPSFNQPSKDQVDFTFNLANGSATGNRLFGGMLLGFGDNPYDATNGIVLGFNTTGTSALNVEFVDGGNRKVTVRVEGLNNTDKKYEFTKALLESAGIPGFNVADIRSITVVVNDVVTGSATASGSVKFLTNSIAFTPELSTTTTDALTDLSALQPAAGELEPCATANQDPCTSGTLNTITTFEQTGNGTVKFNFDLGNGSDDGFRRFGGTLLNFGSNFVDTTSGVVLGFKASGTTALNLEFIDNTGKKVTVRAEGVAGGSFTKYKIDKALLESAGIPGFDATKIAIIGVVVDDILTGSKTASGSVEINTQGLAFSPLAEETTDAVTDFSAQKPTLGELEPCSIPGQDPCVSGTFNTVPNLVQDSADHFSFDYDLSKGSDVEFRRFAGTLLLFGNNVFDATTPIVLGLKGTGTTGGKLKLDIVDNNGNKVTVRVENLTAVTKNFKITKALLDSAGIPGFDATKIEVISIVADDSTTGSNLATGNIDVTTKGLDFTGVNDGATYNAALHTVLPNDPGLLAAGGNTVPNRLPGFITQTQSSDKDYQFVYDLRSSSTAFVFSQIVLDPTGVTLPANLVLGLNGPSGIRIKAEVEDVNGNKITEILGLHGELRNYTLDLTANPLFDRTKVKFITFSLDRQLTEGNNRDTIEVKTAGLDFTPELNGTAFDANAHTLMPNQPNLGAAGANTIPNRLPGFITQTQNSGTNYEFIYDLRSSSTAFVFSQIAFDQDGETLPEDVVLALNGPAGVQVKAELEDINGNKAIYVLNMQGSFRNYTLDLGASSVPAGFDRTKVRFLNLVLDRDLANGNNRDTIQVQTLGLNYTPVVSGTTYDANAHTQLPNRPTLNAAGANTIPNRVPGFITQTQNSNKSYEFIYDLNGSKTAFVFSQINFSNGIANLGNNVVLGLNGPAGVQVKAEIVDVNGEKVVQILNMTGSLKNYNLALTGSHVPAGFDKTQIQFINLVLDRDLAGGNNRDTIEVMTNGLDFAARVDGATFNDAALTEYVNSPALTATGGNTDPNRVPGAITLTPISDEEFKYVYNLNVSQTSFAVTKLDFGGTPESLPENFVIAARGGEGSQTEVNVYDTNNNVASFVLNLRPVYQNYTLQLTAENVPAGFDRTSIQRIEFVQDRNRLDNNLNELVKIRTKNVQFTAPAALPAELQAVKDDLIDRGLNFFKQGVGLDPDTHFPYDAINTDGVLEANSKFTQPTLIGFYLQMLGDAVNGHLDLGLTEAELLTEIEFVMDNLLQVQTDHGWNGLLPFLHLQPSISPVDTVGIGDNLNLLQSLAVLIGSLEGAGLSGASQTQATSIATKANTFMDNQEAGYVASVHPTFGLFRAAYNTSTQTFDSFLDRTATEFMGGIALAVIRYNNVPDSVWTDLANPVQNYKDQKGKTIPNLATFDGSAFQTFWPLLKNNLLDFVDYRNALHNGYATQSDWANKFHIPGFISAAEIPEDHQYVGDLGIRDISENGIQELTMDIGSTYALASAYLVDPVKTLEWLKAIKDELPATYGTYGFVDSARSNTEVAKRFLGIDLASTVLGLSGQGPAAFDLYLQNRGLELDYNLLLDIKGDEFPIAKEGSIAAPPEFPDRSLAVFRNLESTGIINNFPADTSVSTGAKFQYGALTGGFGGQVFTLDQVYDATANQLVIQYSVIDSPQQLKFEFKDSADVTLFTATPTLVNQTSGLNTAKLVIDLPNQVAMETLKKVVIVVDQNATGDQSGDFFIHSMVFQHLPSSQNLTPDANLGSGDVTELPGDPPAQLVSASGGSTLNRVSEDLSQLNFNLNTDAFAGISINFDPNNNGSSADLSGLSSIIFGIGSDKADKIKIEIDDEAGNRAVYYVTDIDSTRQYYEFMTSLAAQSIDLTKVKRINLIVDSSSVTSGNEIGSFELEIGGLLFP